MQHLQPGTTLQGGKYKIEKVLGQGGFGITYLAIQSGLERKVAIKEFFIKELCERDESTSHVTLGTSGSAETVARFREKFLKEARNIARLNHPNIVRVIDVFEENGTAYYVMEYAEKGSLSDKVKREGYLTEPMATRYILQVASALEYIHQQKMNHLDIKPANIMLNEKDEAVLIDFGLSKQYDAVTGNQTSTTPVGISEGYAPMEQYMQGGVGAFSPETDIYALGATYYKLLTGMTPPNASFVSNEGLPLNELKSKYVSQKAIDVICKAMEGRKRDRMKEIGTFIALLKGDAPAKKASGASPRMMQEDESTKIISDESTAYVKNPTPSGSDRPQSVKPAPAPSLASSDTSGNGKFYGILAFCIVLGLVIGVGVVRCKESSGGGYAATDSVWCDSICEEVAEVVDTYAIDSCDYDYYYDPYDYEGLDTILAE